MPNNALTRTIKRAIWFRSARLLRKNTVRSIRQLEGLIESIEKQWRTAKSLGLTKYLVLYNSICFLLLLHYDFAVLSYNHATEVDELKQNLYARQLALLLHEALEDVPAILGGEFRRAVGTLPSGASHLSALSPILKSLSSLRKTHQSQIADIRNFVAAHRDHDALKQLEIMRGIRSIWLVSISSEFTEFLGNVARALTPLITEMGKPGVIISHYVGAA